MAAALHRRQRHLLRAGVAGRGVGDALRRLAGAGRDGMQAFRGVVLTCCRHTIVVSLNRVPAGEASCCGDRMSTAASRAAAAAAPAAGRRATTVFQTKR